MKRLTSREAKKAMKSLLYTAGWALRKVYPASMAREIEHSFRDDPAELVAIAARDLQNKIKQ